MNFNIIYLPLLLSIIGILYTIYLSFWIKKQDTGNLKMLKIAQNIRKGALAFLSAEYRILLIFVLLASIALYIISISVVTTHWFIVIAFIGGAVFSALAGNIGMRIATKSNVRTTQAAAANNLPKALKISFYGGTVMGLGVAGLAVLGLTLSFILLIENFMGQSGSFYNNMTIVLEALAGFSLGAESIALFARVGGGIYTKAADVGADLVGKVEVGIPEDDPRNPATIADNVGDNVGDVAGMGADLFGSYVATVLASMVLGNYIIKDISIATGSFVDNFQNMGPILLPLIIAGIGIISSIIGTLFVRIKTNAKEKQVQNSLNRGNFISVGITAIVGFFLIRWMLPKTLYGIEFFGEAAKNIPNINIFWVTIIGLAVGLIISYFTEYYTALGKKPVLGIVKNSFTGAGTNIIAGLSTGMLSTVGPIFIFAASIWGAYSLAGFYGIALAASTMMATTGMQLAIDAFGPIADNAGGIAEMSGLPKKVREKTDILDSVGNTTAAIGKGICYCICCAYCLSAFCCLCDIYRN